MLQVATEVSNSSMNDDEIILAHSALALIDSMAQQLPASQVIVPLLKVLRQYSESPKPNDRRAEILGLGMGVEGTTDFLLE
jgi:hypothetical protein